MNDLLLNLQQWEDTYKPIIDNETEGDLSFETWEEAYKYVEEKVLKNKEIADEGNHPYRYIWSRKDSEISETTILENGYRPCNSFEYIVCSEPWGTMDSDYNAEVYLQVADYDDRI